MAESYNPLNVLAIAQVYFVIFFLLLTTWFRFLKNVYLFIHFYLESRIIEKDNHRENSILWLTPQKIAKAEVRSQGFFLPIFLL